MDAVPSLGKANATTRFHQSDYRFSGRMAACGARAPLTIITLTIGTLWLWR